ncbi:MAG: phosphoribosylglycinamide formyltransferase [Bacteroidia bacterium]|nr:phosphoribosylglycinamide formyltransferase [Bacteroidota bacterium]MBP9081476.1 phosphoribosylglycinamide formyltransferase [Bacteroidia bacterium]MBK7971570.1 phosphoribosylglycinamide formyltransferase [Bacteroidota bacterium]MBK8872927.1 phosphoribosylglycinamide formyltransferase [Bacteroidota bacterium]MBK9422948.1 phosphoribosylglycinamide formyltransferase [Bacteroidota bacterium]
MKKLAILASGSGSNAENLVNYFSNHPLARVELVISDRKNAFVHERMARLGIPSYYMNKEEFENGSVLTFLQEKEIDLVILAGFLKLVPQDLIRSFHNRIINIHPALLPSFGGKGMYGMHVHEAVVAGGATKTGITIHYVNENFDEGEIIAQYETELLKTDTPQDVAAKIHELEMKWFPVVVAQLLSNEKPL